MILSEKEELMQLLILRKRGEVTGSFYEFIYYFWDTIIKDAPVWNWHIKALADELQVVGLRVKDKLPKEYDVIINIPPGSTKSTIATVMFPVWCWVICPTMRLITASYSASLAINHAVLSKDIIRSDKFTQMFPDLKIEHGKDGKTDYSNTEGGRRFATSVGGSITGLHGDILIWDDPVNPGQAVSDVERQNANDWLDKTFSTRKTDKAITPEIGIMQRLHEDDPTGHILAREANINHICLPGELTDGTTERYKSMYVDGLLDPVRLSRSVLDEMFKKLQSYGYAGQVLQMPSPDEGGKLKKDWFEIVPEGEFKAKYSGGRVNAYVDTAYTKNTENDPTGIIFCTHIRNTIYVIQCFERWWEFHELVKGLPELCEQFAQPSSKVTIEPKASGLSVIQQLREQTKLNIIKGKAPKDDKETRVSSIAPSVEAGRVKLVKGQWNEHFINQCATFPNAKHDEFVDCLCMAVDDYLLGNDGFLL